MCFGCAGMLSCRPDFPGYVSPPIAFNIAIIFLLCSVLEGINGDDDSERSVVNYLGVCILTVLGTFQQGRSADELKVTIYTEHILVKSIWHVK